ncbi:MAG: alpha/beta fold hydrolase [Patescibacteria group bacterium]|nr:alpha/beta fold hydrolase [Patescibacteria group bacterium]
MPRPVTFKTEDGVTIAANFCRGRGTGPVALLLHMMPATKESWLIFSPRLVRLGFTVLAIDLRGHGGSSQGPDGHLDYKLFEDEDHQKKILDVEAAVKYLTDTLGERGRRPVIVGASIGANLAIAFAGDHPEIPAVAALSPGLDYRGITTPDKVKRLKDNQALFLAASEEDELSFKTNRELKLIKPDATLKEYHGAGHGTAMFEREPALLDELAEWCQAHAAKA